MFLSKKKRKRKKETYLIAHLSISFFSQPTDNKEELQTIADLNERERRLVELNVHNSMRNVYITNIVQDAWRRGQKLTVHGWCYELQTGWVLRMGYGILFIYFYLF